MCRYDRFPAAAAEYVGLGLAIFCSMSRVEDGRLASLAWVAFGVDWGALAMSEMCRRPIHASTISSNDRITRSYFVSSLKSSQVGQIFGEASLSSLADQMPSCRAVDWKSG